MMQMHCEMFFPAFFSASWHDLKQHSLIGLAVVVEDVFFSHESHHLWDFCDAYTLDVDWTAFEAGAVVEMRVYFH